MKVLENLEPKKVFHYFEEICSIPHGSRNTKQISDYLVDFAKAHGLTYYQDELNNVVIIKEASKGYENAEPVIIQGHMDMVCEKEKGCDIDFDLVEMMGSLLHMHLQYWILTNLHIHVWKLLLRLMRRSVCSGQSISICLC